LAYFSQVRLRRPSSARSELRGFATKKSFQMTSIYLKCALGGGRIELPAYSV
ncbi:MAG: hypothetical protein G01um101433_1109, partial [Parcubacteria group bacterium Gr01-1014_33]